MLPVHVCLNRQLKLRSKDILKRKYILYSQYLFSCRDQSSGKTEGAVQSNFLTVARLLSPEVYARLCDF